MSKKINIDVWRFIVSFLIVAIHISPFAEISPEFNFFITRILGRIAVPLFLMITGYYVLDKSLDNVEKLKDYTKKTLKMYLFCIILYIPINIYMGNFSNIDFIQIIKDILINGTLYHLWYFPALILGLWITYYLIKKMGVKKTFLIAIFLYLIGLFGDSYYGITAMNGIVINVYNAIFKICDYTRNGLFLVPIFLCMGYMAKISKSKHTLNLYFSLILFICMTLEGMILHHLNYQRHDSMYIFLIPLMYYLFNYLIEKSESSDKKIRNIATSIYIFHPLCIVAVRFMAGIIGLEKIFIKNNLILYITVCLGTLIFSILIERIKEVVINERKIKEQSMD